MCRHSTNLGGNSKGDPPVPIPNTVVKPLYADGTWTDTSRESKKPPDTKYSSIAQSVEHSAVNRSVVGSSPTGGVKRSTSENLSIFLCLRTGAFRYLPHTLAPTYPYSRKNVDISAPICLFQTCTRAVPQRYYPCLPQMDRWLSKRHRKSNIQ